MEDLGRYGEAIQAYQRAIDHGYGYFLSYFEMGEALDALGRHAEAEEAYKQAQIPQGSDDNYIQYYLQKHMSLKLQESYLMTETRHFMVTKLAIAFFVNCIK